MGKGYAEGSAVEERLAALERGDDLDAQLDSGRTAVYGSTEDEPETHFIGWLGEVDPDALFASGGGVGHPDRPPQASHGLADGQRRALELRDRAGVHLRDELHAERVAPGRELRLRQRDRRAGAAPPRSAPRRAATGRPSLRVERDEVEAVAVAAERARVAGLGERRRVLERRRGDLRREPGADGRAALRASRSLPRPPAATRRRAGRGARRRAPACTRRSAIAARTARRARRRAPAAPCRSPSRVRSRAAAGSRASTGPCPAQAPGGTRRHRRRAPASARERSLRVRVAVERRVRRAQSGSAAATDCRNAVSVAAYDVAVAVVARGREDEIAQAWHLLRERRCVLRERGAARQSSAGSGVAFSSITTPSPCGSCCSAAMRPGSGAVAPAGHVHADAREAQAALLRRDALRRVVEPRADRERRRRSRASRRSSASFAGGFFAAEPTRTIGSASNDAGCRPSRPR